jgi:hypothetical protein
VVTEGSVAMAHMAIMLAVQGLYNSNLSFFLFNVYIYNKIN